MKASICIHFLYSGPDGEWRIVALSALRVVSARALPAHRIGDFTCKKWIKRPTQRFIDEIK